MVGKSGKKAVTLGVTLVCSALILGACTPKTAVRGNLPRPHQMEELKIGQNKNEVARILGTPSTVGTFDSNTWYYMSRTTEHWAFFEPEVVDHQVLVLYFDENQVLSNQQLYTKEDLREIALQERETPTSGHELGILEQLLGNFGKFN